MEKKSSLKSIADLITQLEKLNLSPMGSAQQTAKISKKKDLMLIIKQLVINFDDLLSSKLRIDLTQKNLRKEDNHYWTFLSKYYQIPSVKFCSFTDQVKNNKERGMLWILLSITEKSFNESINEIYKQNFDKKFYDQTSLIVLKKKEILDLCQKLHNIYLLNIMGDINNEYLKYKQTLETQKEKEKENNVDLDFLGVNVNPITTDNNNNNANYNNNTNTNNNNKANNPDKPMSPINNPLNSNHMFMSNLEIENILDNLNDDSTGNNNLNSFLFSNKSIDSHIYELVPDKKNSNDFPILEIEGNPENYVNYVGGNKKKNIQPTNKKSNIRVVTNTSDVIPDEGLFSKLKYDKNNNFVISKVSDFQNCYREEFYTFKQQKKNMADDDDNMENNTKSKFSLNLNPVKKIYFPLDKHFKIKRKADRNLFSKKDIVLFKNKEVKITNSILYYLNNIYHKQKYIKFKTRKNNLKPITIESQNFQCYLCKKKFNLIFGIPTEKIFWCSYYLKFICSNCIDGNYSFIPEFILKNWNFKKFTISKQAKQLLEIWKDKPVIQIKHNDVLFKKAPKLRDAIIYKRKIHKIFDLMKCDKLLEVTESILKERIYLVLHENFFSLQDLIEIYEQTFITKLSDFYEKMKAHILTDCEVCHYNGGKCFMCNNQETIYAFDVENVIFCNDCKKIFHRKCCTVHPCIINR